MSPDNLTTEQRSKAMRAVKQSDSEIEIILRKKLWKLGYRYRKNYRRVYGTPDIVFVSLKIAIFCDSEFWHGYKWEEKKFEISSNRNFWWPKIEGNIQRDHEVNRKLKKDGWIVLRFWGHQIKKAPQKCVAKIEEKIHKRLANNNN
jgi:DNA mismatch endonuclease Vsr